MLLFIISVQYNIYFPRLIVTDTTITYNYQHMTESVTVYYVLLELLQGLFVARNAECKVLAMQLECELDFGSGNMPLS